MKRALLALVTAGALAAPAARAETVGLFAPSAPFSGPVARLEFVSALAAHLGQGWNGRAYAKASDFAAAVKHGDLQYAVVDAPYLAALGSPVRVLASAERRGATEAPWEVVASPGPTGLAALRGKTVAVPDVGVGVDSFLYQVLLEGELGTDFFGHVIRAPDALSALAAVERGRADAAFVPSGLPRPAGLTTLVALRPVSWPMLVALPGASDAPIAYAVSSFQGEVLARFVPGGGDRLRTLSARLAARKARTAPLLIPDLRDVAAALVGARTFTIPRPDPRAYIVPVTPPASVPR